MFARLSSRIGGVAAVSSRALLGRTATATVRSKATIAASASSSVSSLSASSPSSSATAAFLHTSARVAMGAEEYAFDPPDPNKPVKVTFIDLNNRRRTVTGYANESLLDVSNRLDIGIDGACGGGSAPIEKFGDGSMCSFCHVRIPSGWHDKLPEQDYKEIQNLNDCRPPSDALSRLACQIRLTPALDGITVALTVNLQPNNYINEMVLHPEEKLDRAVHRDEIEANPEFFAELAEHRDRELNEGARNPKFSSVSPDKFE